MTRVSDRCNWTPRKAEMPCSAATSISQAVEGSGFSSRKRLTYDLEQLGIEAGHQEKRRCLVQLRQA
ncbi:hypothetical protein [Halobacillus sp. Marseille-Q1614]|uniref:hypothetical protein n=1 Tax=Halobacillus sp. Marseille-Q1614 TaxID=2709134 RepID=UPI0015713F70|nr:hypothetical protein [Halobacillus sp. Marseille-Q1614]